MKNRVVTTWLLKWSSEKNTFVYWKKYLYGMPISRVGETFYDPKEKELYEVKDVVYVQEVKHVGIYIDIKK